MSAKRRNNEFLDRIAVRIKQLRLEKDVTQETFYNDTGIHVARIEQSKRDFNMTTLNEICEYFDITIEEFFRDI